MESNHGVSASDNIQTNEMLESITDAIYAVDSHWKLIYLNNRTEQWWDRSRESLLGTVLWNLYPDPEKSVAWQMHHEAMDARHPVHWEAFSPNMKIWVNAHAYPLSSGGLFVYFRDVSERKEMEATLLRRTLELERKEEETLALMDGAFEGSWIVDYLAGTIKCSEKWSRRIALDKVPENERLAYTRTLIHPDDGANGNLIEHCILAGKSRFNLEYRIRTADAGYVWTQNRGKVVYNEFGEAVKVYATVTDITERKRAEDALRSSERHALELAAELERKNRFVTDFFINISHEFKTPLTILMMGLDILEKKVDAMQCGESVAKNLAAMKQNSYRLNKLVVNLLDITKLDDGFMKPRWETVDTAGLMRNLALSVEPYAKQKRLSLKCSCNVEKFEFTTDSFMLERIVLNLLSNAIKHTPAGGMIRIRCQAGENGFSISVDDTGEGIPDEKKAIIFDRFSQVDTSMTRASEGTGIGLALAKSLVELLGGAITFVSALGRGSTFTVELPVLQMALNGVAIRKDDMQMQKWVQMEMSDIIV